MTPGHNNKREAIAKHRAKRDLAKFTREWHRETRARRKAAKGADEELDRVAAALTERLPVTWHQSASRGELEVATDTGGVSIRVKRRLKGKRWHCTAWAKGLKIASFRADEAVAALDGGLAQVEDLRRRLIL